MEYAIYAVVALIVLGLGSYFFLMLFYPEWVGITGASGKKTMSEHAEGSAAQDEGILDEFTKK